MAVLRVILHFTVQAIICKLVNESSREEGVSPGKNVALHRRLHPNPVASKTLDDDGVGRRVLALHRVCARVEQVLAVAVKSHSRLSVDV